MKQIRAVTTLLAALAPGAVAACTLCHNSTAELVRQRLFGPDFWTNALLVPLPIAVLVTGVLLLARDPAGSA